MAEIQETAPSADSAIHDWPMRPWILAAGLGLAGLLVHLFSHNGENDPARMAATAFVFFGAIALALAFEPGRWRAPAIFAFLAGLVMAGIAWRATSAGDRYSDEHFWIGAGIIAVTLALPLFQAGFHQARFRTSYREIHFHLWTDAISGAGALAFTGLAWLLLLLLGNLFELVGISLLMDAVDEAWFGWTFSGAAFGAALGTLRNELKILGTMQNVLMLVLSLLAVPLAAALAIFLAALLVSGLDMLWNATDSPTPLLLSCAAGAFVLANTILRDGEDTMRKSPVLRITALVLALSILPLVVFAAISMGARVAQYGLSPERLWGLVAVAVACAYGLAYWVGALRGRKAGWPGPVRQANVHLAVTIAVVAIVLALPIFDFGAISARNQMARLEAGKVSPEKFDYTALRWDFGEAGRDALKEMAQRDDDIGKRAQLALDQEERRWGPEQATRLASDFDLRIEPDNPRLRAQVLEYLQTRPELCAAHCVALDLGAGPEGQREIALVQNYGYTRLILPTPADAGRATEPPIEPLEAAGPLRPDSTVEIREETRRYIFIDGKPLPQPLD